MPALRTNDPALRQASGRLVAVRLRQIETKLRQRGSIATRTLLVGERRSLTNAAEYGRRATSSIFIRETARITRLAIRTIYDDVRRFDELGDLLLRAIANTKLDTGRAMKRLMDLPPRERELAV